jgi:hypothetical protein
MTFPKRLAMCLTALLSLMPLQAPAAGTGADCYTKYYKKKQTACIDNLLRAVEAAPPTNDPFKVPEAITGFLAQVFVTDETEKKAILAQKLSPKTKGAIVASLYRAAQSQQAEDFARANNLEAVLKVIAEMYLSPIKNIEPKSYPGDNDVLIGAYMASGDIDYIKKILNNYTSASDQMVHDAFRMGFMQGKFGSKAPGRNDDMAATLCERYECKKSPRDFYRVLTLSTAYWATSSIAKNDEGVKKTVDEFFKSDPRVNSIQEEERTNFGNYLVSYAIYKADVSRATMDKSLQVFEHFGSNKEMIDAAMSK